MSLFAQNTEASPQLYRASLRSTLKMEGIGLHSGKRVRLKMEPASPGTGIVFHNQSKSKGKILLSPLNVVSTFNATSLSNGKWHLQTVEHLLAALYGAGITDLHIILDQPQERVEIPILDGSAYPWYEALTQTGIEHSQIELQPVIIHTPVWVVEGDKYLIALPQDHLSVHYSIDYEHPLLSKKSLYIEFDEGAKIAEEILPARTFGFFKEVEQMKSQGLIKGGSIDNALVLTEEGYMNKKLRFSDECLRHKVLDLLGDLYLLGAPLKAHLIAFKAGHTLDISLARKILECMQGDELACYRNRAEP